MRERATLFAAWLDELRFLAETRTATSRRVHATASQARPVPSVMRLRPSSSFRTCS